MWTAASGVGGAVCFVISCLLWNGAPTSAARSVPISIKFGFSVREAVAPRPQDRVRRRVLAVADAAEHHPAGVEPQHVVDLVDAGLQLHHAAEAVRVDRLGTDPVDRVLDPAGVVVAGGPPPDGLHPRGVDEPHYVRQFRAVAVAGGGEVGDPVAACVQGGDQPPALPIVG